MIKKGRHRKNGYFQPHSPSFYHLSLICLLHPPHVASQIVKNYFWEFKYQENHQWVIKDSNDIINYMHSFYHHNFALLTVTHHWSLQLLLPSCHDACGRRNVRKITSYVYEMWTFKKYTVATSSFEHTPFPHVTISHYFWVPPSRMAPMLYIEFQWNLH